MDYAAWVTPAVREVLEKPILVIGCGSIGKRHAKNLVGLGAKKVWLYDSNLDYLLETLRFNKSPEASEYGDLWRWEREVTVFEYLTDALDEKPVASLICTPTSEHWDNIIQCEKVAVPNILVEKPVDNRILPPSYPKGIEANTLVACNLRFTKGLQRVKQLIDDGAIGKVISARANFGYDLAKWRPGTDHKKSYSANKSMGGGILLDAIHEWDYMAWLFGDIAEAKGFKARLSDVTVDTEDVVEVALRFKSGLVGSIHADYLVPKYTRTLWVTTDKGEAGWTLDAPAGKEYLWGLAADGDEYLYERIDVNDMYVEEMKHFLRVCAGEEKSCNTVSEGYKLLEVVLRSVQ